jgi:hypothetical protein
MDLRSGAPRSPSTTLGGIHFLPRSTDKMRADLAGTAGAYNAGTGHSTQVSRRFGSDAQALAAIVRANLTDDEVLSVCNATRTPIDTGIARFNSSKFTMLVNFIVSSTETKPRKAS